MMLQNITKEMKGTDRPTIFWLHRSFNPHRFEIIKSTGRIEALFNMPRPAQQPCPECPDGVVKFAMQPVREWAEHLDDIVISFKRNVPHELPDRLSYKGMTLVTERCRRVFEAVDPDGGHIFLPSEVTGEDGQSLGGPWFYMWCGRIYGARRVKHTSNIIQDSPSVRHHYDTALATPDRCAFFVDMPVWTSNVARGPTYLSRPVFEALNAAGLTGFREYTTFNGFDLTSDDDSWADVVTPQNVSHIWL